MARIISQSGLDALASGRIGFAWFVDIEADEGTLSGTSLDVDVTYNSTDYEGLGDRLGVPQITLASGIVPESISVELSALEIDDTASFEGRLYNRSYHNRRITIKGLLLDADDLTSVIAEGFSYKGFVDSIALDEGQEHILTVRVEGGLFRAVSTNTHVIAHRNQIARSPGDNFFFEIERRVGRDIPFGLSRAQMKS